MSQTSEQLMQDILLYRHNIDLMMMPIVQEFVVEDYDFIMEDGEASAQSGSGEGGSSDSSNGPAPQVVKSDGPKVDKNAPTTEKIKQFLKNLLNKFKAWIQNVMQTVAEKFTKNYQAQINYVSKNKALNEEIAGALGSNFKPTVQDWPKYHIPLDQITKIKLEDVIKKFTEGDMRDKPVTTVDVKKAFYPKEVAEFITESYVIESDAPENTNGEKKEKTKNQKMLWNFFLFGKPNPSHDECWTNNLDGPTWMDTCQNIINCPKAINIGIKEINNDLKNTIATLQQKVANLKESASNYAKESLAARKEGDDATYAVAYKDALHANSTANRLKDLTTAVTEISNEWGVGFAEAMQQAFFVTSYNLYKDIVFEYRKTGGIAAAASQPQNANNNTEQPTT